MKVSNSTLILIPATAFVAAGFTDTTDGFIDYASSSCQRSGMEGFELAATEEGCCYQTIAQARAHLSEWTSHQLYDADCGKEGYKRVVDDLIGAAVKLSKPTELQVAAAKRHRGPGSRTGLRKPLLY